MIFFFFHIKNTKLNHAYSVVVSKTSLSDYLFDEIEKLKFKDLLLSLPYRISTL